MAKDQEFALPGSGYDVLKKILHAYVLCGEKEVALAEVSQKAGMNKTMVSSNNGFFASVGIIQGGRKKTLTQKGRRLAIAVSHDDHEATAAEWREIIGDSQDLCGVIDMIKVQSGVAESTLTSKIASHFGLPGGKGTTGLNAIVDILVDAGVIVAEDDKYVCAKAPTPKEPSPSPEVVDPKDKSVNEDAAASAAVVAVQAERTHHERGGSGTPMVPIHINIELHLPASAEQGVYDAIFKSIRQNLMEPVDGLPEAS